MAPATQCPFVRAHLEECYCSQMNSKYVPETVRYCMRDFERCALYHRLLKERSASFLSYVFQNNMPPGKDEDPEFAAIEDRIEK